MPNLLRTSILLFVISLKTLAQSNSTISFDELFFIENKGQLLDMEKNLVPNVFFKASAPGVDVYVTDKGLTYTFFKMKENEKKLNYFEPFKHKLEFEWERLDMHLKGASIKKENIIVEEKRLSVQNFFLSHCPDGILGVNGYSRITVRNVYPGIDWVLYKVSGKGLKYDFIVHPGANVADIMMSYLSVSPAVLNNNNIQVSRITEDAPFSYIAETGRNVPSKFQILHRSMSAYYCTTDFGVEVEKKYSSETLVIDPNLTWGTYFGGSYWENPSSIESDSKGNVYICGSIAGVSQNFPFYSNGVSYFQGTGVTSDYGFISKFSKYGQLLWSTAYADTTTGSGIALVDMCIDKTDNVFLAGSAGGNAMPLQNNSTYFQSVKLGIQDAFIIKFDSLGSLQWASYFGGDREEWATSICLNENDDVYLTGTTTSSVFPLQNSGGYYESVPDTNGCGFITRFSNNGILLWSTFYHKFNPKGCAIDTSQNLIVVGQATAALSTQSLTGAFFQSSCAGLDDAGILKFDSGDNRTWATFFGGTASERAFSVVADRNGSFFLLGHTTSTNIPLQNSGGYFKPALTGSGDAFIGKFTDSGIMAWSTYYGGSANEGVNAFDNFDLDRCGNLYVGIDTYSSDMPWMYSCEGGYLDTSFGGISDHFVSRFNPIQMQQWGTYIGGSNFDFKTMIELDNVGDLYVAGQWNSNSLTGLPLVNPGSPTYYDGTPNGFNDVGIVKFNNPLFISSFEYPQPSCEITGTVGLINTQLAPAGNFNSTAGLNIESTSGVIDLDMSAPGIYTITYTPATVVGACNCSISPQSIASATYQVLSQPSVTVTGNNTLCPGVMSTLTASGAMSYIWSTAAQTNTIILNPPATEEYFVVGFSKDGCSDTAAIMLVRDLCLGLRKITAQSHISVHPNPSQGKITITGNLNTTLILYDAIGNEIMQVELKEKEQYLNLNDLNAGMYILLDLKSGERYKLIFY